MLESLSKREKNLVNLLLVCVLLASFYWGFGQILLPKYSVVKAEFEAKKIELEQTKALIARFSVIETENRKLAEEAEILKAPLNKAVQNGINYYYIGKHAAAHNVFITKILPKSIEDAKAILHIPFDIKVRGNYLDILSFLNLVENDMPNTTELLFLQLLPYTGEEEEDSKEKASGKQEEKTDKKEEPAKETIKDPVIAGNNPEVTCTLSLVTYMVKSPENLRLAQGITPLGRFDAFQPTVDVTKPPINEADTAVPVLEDDIFFEEDENGGSLVIDNIDFAAESDAETNDPNQNDDKSISEEESNSSVEEVIIKETGDYSFPVRE